MNPLLSIPRQALAELLAASGSTLTPEEYLASLPELSTYKKYPGRVRAAAWSKNILLVVTILAVVCLPFGFDFEDVIIVAGLVAVTFFEYRVHRYFREGNPEAPMLGFRNQSAFAAAILIYGLYHAVVPFQVPAQMQGLFEDNNLTDPATLQLVQGLERASYLIVGIVGGVSQFGLAWYYRNARTTA
jgi:hypothetical protein